MLKIYEEVRFTLVLFSEQDVVRTSGVESDIYGKPDKDSDVFE